MKYSPLLFAFITSTTVLFGLGAYALALRPRRPPRFAAPVLFAAALAAGLQSMEIASAALPMKILLMKLRFIPISIIPVLWLALTLELTGRMRPAMFRPLLAVLLEPVAVIVLALTSSSHRLFRYGFHLATAGSHPALVYETGPLFWVHVIFTYLLLLGCLILLLSAVPGRMPRHRRVLLLLAAAVIPPPVAEALFGMGITIPPGVSLVSVAFVLSGFLLSAALLRARLTDMLPIAGSVLFQTIEDAAIVLDGDGMIVDVNEHAHAVMGSAATRAFGGPLAALPAPWGGALEGLAAGQAEGCEITLGEPPATYTITFTQLRDAAGRPIGRLLLAHDGTEQRKAQAELVKNRERLQLAFDSAADGLWDWDLRTGAMYWSPRMFTMLGHAPGALTPSYDTLKALMHPDDREQAEADMAALLAGEKATNSIAVRLRTCDGDWLCCLSRGRVVERHPDGRAARIVGSHLDITERMGMEVQLRESEDKFRSFIAQSTEAIMLVGEDGLLVEFNPTAERMSGLTRDEALGMPVWKLMSRFTSQENLTPDFQQRMEAGYREALSTGDSDLFRRLLEGELIMPDGTRRWLQHTVFPVRTARRLMIGSVTRDVTDIRNAEEALRRSEEQLQQAHKMEAMGRLAGGIAHDFNNILTVIGGYSDIVREGLPADNPLRKDAEEIFRAARKATELVSQLLAFSRKQVLKPRRVSPNELVRAMLGMLGRVIGEDITLETFLEPEAPGFRADPGQIEQVLMNLAVNARDAMPAGGKLTLETARRFVDDEFAREHPEVKQGEYAQITVSDTGIGMEKDVLSRIFEPFFTTKEQGKGTGLGLSMVYGIIKQSDGHIFCASAPGEGTRFSILLPRCADTQSAQTAQTDGQTRAARGEMILLVEDEAAVRGYAAAVLRKSGYTVLEASGGSEALRLAASTSEPIDLLITDMVMPLMGGRELSLRLRERMQGVRVLYISGYTEEAILRQGALEPGADFAQKPLTAQALLARVREILDRR